VASGAIGTRLVPQLIERGHEVIGTYTSSPEKAAHLQALNLVTGIAFAAGLVIIALLTLWALAGPQFCVTWFINNPVCGA
jgi:uncharacterized protein YbjT (DUF2867 family)